MLFHQRK